MSCVAYGTRLDVDIRAGVPVSWSHGRHPARPGRNVGTMTRNDLAFLDQHARKWGGDEYAEWFMREFGAETEIPDVSHRNQFDRFLAERAA